MIYCLEKLEYLTYDEFTYFIPLITDKKSLNKIIENIRKNGQNPFNDYQVPQAVIKFKQGVGRLIRSKTDSGNIIILDNRIIKKMYGKKFLSFIRITIVWLC